MRSILRRGEAHYLNTTTTTTTITTIGLTSIINTYASASRRLTNLHRTSNNAHYYRFEQQKPCSWQSIKVTSSTGRLKMAFMRLKTIVALLFVALLLFTNVNTPDAKKRRKKKKKKKKEIKVEITQWDYCHACITVVEQFNRAVEKGTSRTLSCHRCSRPVSPKIAYLLFG